MNELKNFKERKINEFQDKFTDVERSNFYSDNTT